jgi:hypothetical protein
VECSTILRLLPDLSTATPERLEGTPNLTIRAECDPEPLAGSTVAARREVSQRAEVPASVEELVGAAKLAVEGVDEHYEV